MKKAKEKEVKGEGKLRKYNEVLFSIIATIMVAAIGGWILIAGLIFVAGLFDGPVKQGIKVAENKDEKKVEEKFEFYRPIINEHSNYIRCRVLACGMFAGSLDVWMFGCSEARRKP